MICRLADFKRREVISLQNGARLGYVGDVELDTEGACLSALIVYGRPRLLGLLGREDDLVIRWEDIQVIGEETILVRSGTVCRRRKRNLLSVFFTE